MTPLCTAAARTLIELCRATQPACSARTDLRCRSWWWGYSSDSLWPIFSPYAPPTPRTSQSRPTGSPRKAPRSSPAYSHSWTWTGRSQRQCRSTRGAGRPPSPGGSCGRPGSAVALTSNPSHITIFALFMCLGNPSMYLFKSNQIKFVDFFQLLICLTSGDQLIFFY